MGPGIADFAALLDPQPLPSFFADYWERRPLLIHRGPDFYQRLITTRDLEDIISSPETRYPAIKLAKEGRFYPPEAYTTDVEVGQCLFSGVPDVVRICEEYGKGASITLPALHRTWKPLNALCARLEQELDHSIHANAYITPGQTAGFPPHYDAHEVLVLQIAGKKRWYINEPSITLPQPDELFKPDGFRPGPLLMEIELQAGDLLYLPRGYVHSTSTSQSHSAHVTIGITVCTWLDLVRACVPSAVATAPLRRALPVGFASRREHWPALIEQLKSTLAALRVDRDPKQLFEEFVRQLSVSKRRLPPHFRADVTVISPDLLLQTPSHERYTFARRDDHFLLDFEGRRYGFTATIWPILTAMCDRVRFRLLDLPQGLDDDSLLRLARYLQSIGFLEPAAR